jgi:membrane-associated phospholipid phosphatase
LAIGLAGCYPHGRWLFGLFALLAALQRIECSAHFPSDTLAGAAVACLWCGICFDPRLLGRRLDRFENVARSSEER